MSKGHAYIITRAEELVSDGKDYRLLRLYNPWGNEDEWKGEWSDKSSMWRRVDDNYKQKLDLSIEYDGEFW